MQKFFGKSNPAIYSSKHYFAEYLVVFFGVLVDLVVSKFRNCGRSYLDNFSNRILMLFV